jgi:virulence-associated protein VapD
MAREIFSTIGHNSSRAGRMYAIIFDLDTNVLGQIYPGPNSNNAYADIRSFLTRRGFEWVQGSGYFGDSTIDAVKCVHVVMQLSKKYPWFKSSVRDLRMLRIEENNDLMVVLNDDEED